MFSDLNINTKILAFDGIIGRRDYFLNIIKISSISILFSIPYTLWIMPNISNFSDFFDINKLFIEAPDLLKFWVIAGSILTCSMIVSNVVRRMNDINGCEKKIINIIVSIIFSLGVFNFVLPGMIFWIIIMLTNIGYLFLMFKPGKITFQLPYDYRKEFNWGACFGTWIWGLFNKSYIPLFYLLLFFTPWGMLFQIYCGLKGNEWAFENKNWKNVEKFNKSQKKQTVFWCIFYLIIIPVLIFAGIFSSAFLMLNLFKENPEGARVNIEKMENKLNSIYFESYYIKKDTNEFYVNPNDWNRYSYSDKQKILEYAATISASSRNKKAEKKRQELELIRQAEIQKVVAAGDEKKLKEIFNTRPSFEYFYKATELPRTKIYSSEDYQLLGEYVKDDEQENKENPNIWKEMKSHIKAYRFYKAQ